jgi:ABC-type multidrug transport system ATPase subunit
MSDPITLEVKNIWVKRGKKLRWQKSSFRGHEIMLPVFENNYLLEDINFKVEPGEFVAIVGPNGAGKTTLLRVIGGERPYFGEIRLRQGSFSGNLYDSPEYWLQQIGQVPVENVLHEHLRVKDALKYVGMLRCPDLSPKDLSDRVDDLLKQFEVAERKDSFIGQTKISSGEQKRVNICAELIAEPPLLLLDEPTSNLDPNAEFSLMERLRDQAHNNHQAIVVVTHTLNTLYLCDKVLFVENRRLLYCATSANAINETLEYIPVPTRDEILKRTDNFNKWVAIFENFRTKGNNKKWWEIFKISNYYMVQNDNEQQQSTDYFKKASRQSSITTPNKRPETPPVRFAHQLKQLLSRYALIRLNDWRVLLITLAMGFVGGFLLFVMPDQAFVNNPKFSSSVNITNTRSNIFLLALIIAFIGLTASFREVSKELAIYKHERLKGLSPAAYLLSKWIWLVIFVGVIAPTMILGMLLFWYRQPLDLQTSAQPIIILLSSLTLILVCIAAITLGLALSAIAGSDNAAAGLLALTVIFHVLLSGLVGNANIKDIIDQLSIFATSHWAVEGFSSSLNIFCWSPTPKFEEYNSWGHIISIYFSLLLYIFFAFVVALTGLFSRDSWNSYSSYKNLILSNAKKTIVIIGIVLCLASWTFYLKQQSLAFYDLVFYDSLYGGWVRPSITKTSSANLIQSTVGFFSQSRCPIIDDTAPPPIDLDNQVLPIPTIATLVPSPNEISTPTPEAAILPLIDLTSTEVANTDLTPDSLSVLPQSKLLLSTEIRYQPDGDTFTNKVDAGQIMAILGKNDLGNWYRVHYQTYIGWIPANSIDFSPSKTNNVATPPLCARPIFVLSNFNQAWTSNVNGRIVSVIDIFRETTETEFQSTKFQVLLNDNSIGTKEVLIQTTRSKYILLGTSFDVQVKEGDKVSFNLTPTQSDVSHFQAIIFRVPDGCSF